MRDSSSDGKLVRDGKKNRDRMKFYGQAGNGAQRTADLDFRINRLYGITEEDKKKGLRHLKWLVKKKFRELAKLYHPDSTIPRSSNGWAGKRELVGAAFNELKRTRDHICSLKVMPVTLDNLESILEVTKGYKSTDDVWLPWE